MEPLVKLLMEHYGLSKDAAPAAAKQILARQPAGPELVNPVDTDRERRKGYLNRPDDPEDAAWEIAKRSGQVRPEDLANRSVQSWAEVMGRVPANMQRLDNADRFKAAEGRIMSRMGAKGRLPELLPSEIVTEKGGDTNPSDPYYVHPVAPVPAAPPVPGQPGHPTEDKWGGITDAMQGPNGLQPGTFSGFTHAEAMDLMAKYLETKRMRALGEWDPSMMTGPL